MSHKPRINFPRDGQRIAVIGTDLIAKMTKTRKWCCRGTMLCFMVRQTHRQCLFILHGQRKDPSSWKSSDHDVNKPEPIQEAYTVTFVEQPNQIFTPWISAKINGTTSLTHKVTLTAWSSPLWDKRFSCFTSALAVDVFWLSEPACQSFGFRQSQRFKCARWGLVAIVRKC